MIFLLLETMFDQNATIKEEEEEEEEDITASEMVCVEPGKISWNLLFHFCDSVKFDDSILATPTEEERQEQQQQQVKRFRFKISALNFKH